MKILIVGAGPAGSYAAKELSKEHEVEVFEEHPQIGRPIACTGIVTKILFDFVEKDESYMVNELDGVDIFSPNGRKVEVPLKEYVICREKFDTYLADKAISDGAKYSLRHKFSGVKNNTALFQKGTETIKREFDILIGADGPFSAVGRAAGLLQGRQYYIGSQATIKGAFNPKRFMTFFGGMAPGFFAWAVPENNKLARVGVATQKHVHKYFDMLREKFNGEIVERQAGPIPIYDGAKNVQRENIYLTGDAAGVCKNTTGGGIITGIWSSKILAESILNETDYSAGLKPLRKELWLHQKLRNTLDKFSDEDYDLLIERMAKPKIKKILYEHPREYPSRFLWKLAIAEPKLLTFIKHLF